MLPSQSNSPATTTPSRSSNSCSVAMCATLGQALCGGLTLSAGCYALAPRASEVCLIHRRAWKGDSANFAMTEFSEVRSEGGSTPGSPTLLAEGWLWGPRADAQSSTHHLLQV